MFINSLPLLQIIPVIAIVANKINNLLHAIAWMDVSITPSPFDYANFKLLSY